MGKKKLLFHFESGNSVYAITINTNLQINLLKRTSRTKYTTADPWQTLCTNQLYRILN